MFICIAVLTLILTILCAMFQQAPASNTEATQFTSRKPVPVSATNTTQRSQRKPGWVKTEVLRLLAITRGKVGSRTIAAMFNARFGYRGESVGKTYVSNLRKSNGYEIKQLRRKLRQAPKPQRPNQTWALDWTNVTIGKQTYNLLGVIDHGSRRLLKLCFADKRALTVLNLLNPLIAKFGKPSAIRTDNDGAFVSAYFALAMRKLGIKHQRSPPQSPWSNGRIERLFGTFKRAIRQIEISTKAQLQQAMDEFAHFYNHIRLHQNIGYRTPAMAWRGQQEFPTQKSPRWFAGWNGVLFGWDWGDATPIASD